jgi:hypothetical protein
LPNLIPKSSCFLLWCRFLGGSSICLFELGAGTRYVDLVCLFVEHMYCFLQSCIVKKKHIEEPIVVDL